MNRKTLVVIAVIVLLAVIGFFAVARKDVVQKAPLVDFFQVLQAQGYTPNAGLNGSLEPGAIIQTTERGPDGQEKALAPPLLFLRAGTCFPDKSPLQSPYALPDSTGTSSASLTLGAAFADKFLPSLGLDSSDAADYSLTFDNPHVLTFARGELSQQFSKACLTSFNRELKAKDKLEWFTVIVEVVAADALNFEITWKSETTVEARNTAKEKMKKTLAAAKVPREKGMPVSAEVRVDSKENNRTALSVDGPVILAYRTRPLYAVTKP
jgi:hypothetical protein